VKFSEPGASLRLVRQTAAGAPQVVIESQGRTVPAAALTRFFDLFAVAEASTPGADLGLGPSTAQRILSLFEASASVANRDGAGMSLTVSLKEAPLDAATG
jgi:K+-sensing histidine kinase KdpD